MSRHMSPALGPRGGKRFIVTGFDRPLQEFFLTIYQGDCAAMDRVTHTMTMSSADEIDEALAALRLTTPSGLVHAVREDGENNVGNRIVQHRFDGPLEVLFAG